MALFSGTKGVFCGDALYYRVFVLYHLSYLFYGVGGEGFECRDSCVSGG